MTSYRVMAATLLGSLAVVPFSVGQTSEAREQDRGSHQEIMAHLGTCTGDANFDPAADLNDDGCINVLDLRLAGDLRSFISAGGTALTYDEVH